MSTIFNSCVARFNSFPQIQFHEGHGSELLHLAPASDSVKTLWSKCLWSNMRQFGKYEKQMKQHWSYPLSLCWIRTLSMPGMPCCIPRCPPFFGTNRRIKERGSLAAGLHVKVRAERSSRQVQSSSVCENLLLISFLVLSLVKHCSTARIG